MTIKVTAKKLKLGELGDKLVDMTREEVIAASVGHILALECPSVGKGNFGCAYNGDDEHGDTCCAAAPFIKEYDSEMEGKPWFNLVARGLVSYNRGVDIALLQEIHDEEYVFSLESKKEKLDYIIRETDWDLELA